MRACLLGAVLGACSSSVAERSTPIPFVLDAGGVQLAGSAQRIDFGRTDHSTIPAMTKLVGSKPEGETACGSVMGVIWPGVTLYFVSGDFRGWKTPDASAGVVCDS